MTEEPSKTEEEEDPTEIEEDIRAAAAMMGHPREISETDPEDASTVEKKDISLKIVLNPENQESSTTTEKEALKESLMIEEEMTEEEEATIETEEMTDTVAREEAMAIVREDIKVVSTMIENPEMTVMEDVEETENTMTVEAVTEEIDPREETVQEVTVAEAEATKEEEEVVLPEAPAQPAND